MYELEKAAYPAIDRLASDVSKGVLEDVSCCCCRL